MKRDTRTIPMTSPGAGRRAGLTTLELLLAVAVTAVLAMAIATVMTGVSRGLAGAGESRSALQRVHAAHMRVRAYTDAALCLLQYDDRHAAGDGLALWLGDDRPGGRVNLSEMRVVWFDSATGELTVERVTFPSNWPAEMLEANDVELPPETDFLQEMSVQRKLGRTTTATVADGLSSAVATYSTNLPREAKRFRLSIGAPTVSAPDQSVLMALALPNHKEPK